MNLKYSKIFHFLSSWVGKIPWEGNGTSFQYSCLENPMDRGAWWATVHQFSSVQSLSQVRLFETPWIAARQASLSITNSRRPPKPMSIESVVPSSMSSSVIPCSSCPQSFPASGLFKWVISLHQVAKVLEFQLQHQSFQWTPRTDLL